ncbi:testicular acid phosphatase homolog [Nasonia vitripennis]|uniref:acid phosphatase n=1 Tax=Nasonia vitripennis TaxID=7425 RepID=A0A7M7Q6L3_NASVI|nr:testicular acid phosphatase homolog [Nasonia vitripennis]
MKQITLFKSFILCSLLSCQLCNATMSALKLELVQVVFRHGARTPGRIEAEHINATDPELYPEGYQELTNEGKQQAYKLGTLLRKKYDEFLGTHNPEEYFATTTDFNRTRMSLQLALTGLFPTVPGDTWNDEIYQNSRDPNIVYVLIPFDTPKYKDLYPRILTNSSEFRQNISKYTEFLEMMENNTGIPFKQNVIYHAGWTCQAIQYHKAAHLPLPSWYTDESIDRNLTELYKLGLDSMSLTTQLRRLNGGTLVRKFIENIKNNRKVALPKKMYLYCAHDLTLNAFSKAQDVEAFYLPPHGSALIMEKYTDSKKSEYVRMLAWDGVSENFTLVRIGSCEEFCSFEDYLNIVKNNVSTDEDIAYLKGVADEGTSS